MKRIFFNYGIEVLENDGRYYIRYDDGEIVEHIDELEVSNKDAMIAQKSATDAYNVILKYQNNRIS